MEDFLAILKGGAAELGTVLPDETAEKLRIHYEFMVEYNQNVNLTAITDVREAAQRHYLDCLCPSAVRLIRGAGSVIDVGSGAGFPGLVLAALLPETSFTLLDSSNKRITFLEQAAEKMALKNVTTLWCRAEDAGRGEHRERYDIATARAVAPLGVLAEYLLPLVKPGGRMVCYKGAALAEELAACGGGIRKLGGSAGIVHLPEKNIDFWKSHVFSCDKISKTPKQYPRKSGTPSKSPLT